MNWLTEVKTTIILILLVCFLGLWNYTEITEFWERSEFNREVNTFMHEGNRNTRQQGYHLCLRIAHLETNHHNMPLVTCEDIYNLKVGD